MFEINGNDKLTILQINVNEFKGKDIIKVVK